jgi:hypothetical protein
VVAGGQQPDAEAAPEAAAGEQGHRDRDEAQDDQVPGVVVLERLLEQHVHDRADDRPLDRAEAADDHRERHLGRPLHAEHAAGRPGLHP